ncbi:MAG: glycosyltransferase [Patescibacteria group bacterium]|nr:glycosyltransferase [Patescibacteria group bacterium]
MKMAFVYDRVNKFGGAEQVLLALHEIWRDAPLYTAFFNKKRAPWAKDFTVYVSFANMFPFASTYHELYPWLAPFAFESFKFDGYDVVLSVTSAEAKSILTKPETCHICYCLTPTRYLWSGYETYKKHPLFSHFLSDLGSTMRRWDKYFSSRPDVYIAISSLVKKRIESYYEREVAAIIHPPVNTQVFTIAKKPRPAYLPREYFLVVSRLVPYKRIDLLIQVFNTLRFPLIVIGNGCELKRLRSMAGSTITFITEKLTEENLAEYYQYCDAFVFAAEEDFGIVAAEAQAAGKPVIAYKQSGVADIVNDETGILFENQTQEDIIEAIRLFEKRRFDRSVCRRQGMKFSKQSFQRKIKSFIEKTVKKFSL